MNMKKTIAAAAAGAMAVSATATAASAATAATALPAEGAFRYSLVKSFAEAQDGSATVMTERRLTSIDESSGILINLGATLSGITVDKEAEASLYVMATDDNTPIVAPYITIAGEKRTGLSESVFYDDLGLDEDSNAGADAGYLVISPSIALGRNSAWENILVRYTAKVKLGVAAPDKQGEVSADLNASALLGIGVVDEDSTVPSVVAAAAGTDFTVGRKTVTDFVAYNSDGKVYKAPMVSHTNTTRYDGGVPNIIAYLEGYDDLYATGNLGNYYYLQGTANSFPIARDPASISAKAKSVRTLQYIGQNTEYKNTQNIADAKDYQNVISVLNDTIANYDVKFTFTTAQDNVYDSNDADVVGGDAYLGTYSGAADKGDAGYKSFNQHLYGLYGNDLTALPTTDVYAPFTQATYFGNSNVNFNLFQGGLIVNDYYSMQLAQTELFSYSATTLSFSMNTVKANAIANYNSWMDYIQSLRLATSTEWYWDSMTVTWTTPVVESAESGEGIESDEVGLEDEVPAAEEEVVVPEEETPVAPAANPETGNSAVALAVIPVALAAAAIVAKKRK